MGRRGKDLTPSVKETLFKLYEQGYSGRKIAEVLEIDFSTVYKCLKRLKQAENLENINVNKRVGKCGRKKMTGEMSDRVLLKVVKNNRRKTLTEITSEYNKSTPYKLSKRTVQRRLHFYGYYRRVVKKTTTIAKRNRIKRRAFARSHIHWKTEGDWSRVIFSDETQIVIGKDKRVYVWRTNDELEMHVCKTLCPQLYACP